MLELKNIVKIYQGGTVNETCLFDEFRCLGHIACDYRVFDEQIDDAQRDRRGEDNENKCLHDSSASHLLLRECFAVADFQLLTVTDRDLGETAARDVVLDNVARRWV